MTTKNLSDELMAEVQEMKRGKGLSEDLPRNGKKMKNLSVKLY